MLMENYVSDLSWKDYQDFRYGNADYLFFVGERSQQQRDMQLEAHSGTSW